MRVGLWRSSRSSDGREPSPATRGVSEGHCPSETEESQETGEDRPDDVESLLEQTKDDLYELAQELDIEDWSKMNKQELADAIIEVKD